jgi:hypothetical protein
MSTLKQFQKKANMLIPQIDALLRQEGLDEFQTRAFGQIRERVIEMRDEATVGNPSPKRGRRGEIARIVEESDPTRLLAGLGGMLMDIEKEYHEGLL